MGEEGECWVAGFVWKEERFGGGGGGEGVVVDVDDC